MTSSLSCAYVTRLARSDDDACDRVSHRLRQSECRLAARRPTTPARRIGGFGERWPPSLAAEHEAVVELSAAAGGTADQHLRGGHGRRDQGRYPLFAPAIFPPAGPSASPALGRESA